MHLQLESVLPCLYEEAVHHVKTPRLLQFIAQPLVKFVPAEDTVVPSQWEESTYWFHLRIFGVLPFGKQAVRISFHREDGVFKVRDNGYSALIKRWDHWMEIRRLDSGVFYSDTLDLDAGLLTPFIYLFARVFYAHRQRRWLKLATNGFDYGGSWQ